MAILERGGSHPRWPAWIFFGIDLVMGIWAVWLYTAIAPRHGAGPRAAVVAGVAWWTIKTLQSAKWVGLGFAPGNVVLVPLATTLVAAVAATVLGAWLFERTRGSPPQERPLGRRRRK